MTRADAARWAERWAGDWNRRDLDAVLAHFADDVVWTSPRCVDAVGVPTLHGKAAVQAYYAAALARVASLRFTVRRILWDRESTELSIVYDRDVDGHRDRASEILRFDRHGRVVHGEVHYGLVPA